MKKEEHDYGLYQQEVEDELCQKERKEKKKMEAIVLFSN